MKFLRLIIEMGSKMNYNKTEHMVDKGMSKMKIIHCADLHLDSKMNRHLAGEKRKERKAELLNSYYRMIRYAKEHDVEVILITGDMFDTNVISKTAGSMVWNSIKQNPEICFYYIRGNHDNIGFWEQYGEVPDNLKLFDCNWKYYSHPCRKGQLVIAGAELNGSNMNTLCKNLYLHPDAFNIVMLHGQEQEYKGQDGTPVIPVREFREKNIDYLALGHVHSYKQGTVDGRGIWCYPGCLEGRGFDECGEHGFVLLELEEETGFFEVRFIPFAERNLYTVPVDISKACCMDEISDAVERKLAESGFDRRSMIKVILTGEVDYSCDKDLTLLTKRLEHLFYYIKFADQTKRRVEPEQFRYDESLKGEFVRAVLSSEEIPEEEMAEIIRCGIRMLSGEEME